MNDLTRDAISYLLHKARDTSVVMRHHCPCTEGAGSTFNATVRSSDLLSIESDIENALKLLTMKLEAA